MATTKPFVSNSFTYETLEEKLDIKAKGESLFIGMPKENSFNENRIALTPEAAGVLIANGHQVAMETNAGLGSNYSDHDFSEVGTKIVYDKFIMFVYLISLFPTERFSNYNKINTIYDLYYNN